MQKARPGAGTRFVANNTSFVQLIPLSHDSVQWRTVARKHKASTGLDFV